ncbi:MAG: site-2 protease family protein [Clostridia bacterium]|nr:site-2 protease family protein [Clostridia bacterium]
MKRELSFKVGDINILFDCLIMVVIFIMLATGYLLEFFIILASIFLHELGHILTAVRFGCKITFLKILPIGMNAVVDTDICSRSERVLIDISGPLINILLAFFSFIAYICCIPFKSIWHFLMLANIYLALFNLLPVMPLDGGRILKDILIEVFGIFFTNRLIKYLSICFSFVVISAGICQLTQETSNFSLVVIGFYILTSSFKGMEAAIMNIKNVIYRRSRLLKKGIYQARDLVVVRNMHLSDIIKNLDFDRFHIIHVLDDELKLIKTFTEHEVIEGILRHSSELTFGEFIEKDYSSNCSK